MADKKHLNRAANQLGGLDIDVPTLCRMTDVEIIRTPNLGRQSWRSIRQAIDSFEAASEESRQFQEATTDRLLVSCA